MDHEKQRGKKVKFENKSKILQLLAFRQMHVKVKQKYSIVHSEEID